MSDEQERRKSCPRCRSLANREKRMIHPKCFFAWCRKKGITYPGENEFKIRPENAYRVYHAPGDTPPL